ncbi:SAGA HAT/Core module component [Mortierella sp. AD094]|nr:SAGA HAT/Core module component [Mortierella sp. AD094]
MDRKNYRAGGTVGITPSAAASTNAVITGDDAQDEAVVWKRVLADLQRLSEIIDSNEGIIIALDKVPEVDNTPEGKRKKRKIEAEGLISNSKKIRRYSSTDPNGIIPVGHQVAARTPKDKNKVEEWILARVLAYHADKNRYHVEDDEADENGEKMKYQLSARSVIMIADDQEDIPEFPAGHTVLALYPSTTCFYKAIVVQPPSKNKDYPTPLYRIKFDDDEGNERTAPPRMVLDMPKLK